MILVLPILFIGCSDSSERLSPCRWVKVSPEIDSITMSLEHGFYDWAESDSLGTRISRMAELAETVHQQEMVKIRSRYWRARYLLRIGEADSAYTEVVETLNDMDSASYPYEFFRLRALMRVFSQKGGTRSYTEIDEEARYYESIGDEPMLATSYISLGNSLYGIGELDRSLEFLQKADELNRTLGYNKVVVKNAINIANIKFSKGDVKGGADILHDLLADSVMSEDIGARNKVLRNLYSNTNDISYLRRAYDDVKGKVEQRDMQGLYQALLCRHFAEQGDVDSASNYSRLAMSNIDYIGDVTARGIVMQSYADLMEREGKVDSALFYQKQYVQCADSDYTRMENAEVLRLANMREVLLAMSREQEQAQRMKFNYIGAFILIMSASVAYFLVYRRQKRHQIASRDSRLEMEKSRRSLLALMLAVEEKNNLFSSLKTEIEKMRKEGSIGATEATHLQNNIQMHLTGGEEWETFQQQFVQVYPVFVQRLHNAYPGLADSYVKLATYIYMGLDNNRIARLLVIRPESVKQARWRMRKMMGLSKDVSLDDAIRALGNQNDRR